MLLYKFCYLYILLRMKIDLINFVSIKFVTYKNWPFKKWPYEKCNWSDPALGSVWEMLDSNPVPLPQKYCALHTLDISSKKNLFRNYIPKKYKNTSQSENIMYWKKILGLKMLPKKLFKKELNYCFFWPESLFRGSPLYLHF